MDKEFWIDEIIRRYKEAAPGALKQIIGEVKEEINHARKEGSNE